MVESIALMGCVGGALGLGVILGYTLAQRPTVWHKPIEERKPRVKLADLSSGEITNGDYLRHCADADDLKYWPDQRPDKFMGCG